MTRRLTQSTAYTVMLKLFLSSDHLSVATGKTVAIKLSKAGGAFANPNAGASNATEVSDGWYKFALDTTDTNTVGDLVIRATSASCDDSEQVMQVTDDPTKITAIKTKTDSLTFTVAGMIDANVIDWKGSAAPAMTGDAYARLGAPAGASIAADIAAVKVDTANIYSKVDTEIATLQTTATAIKASTDNLPSDPADESLVIAATSAIAALIGTPSVSVSADLAAVQAHGDGAWATAAGFATAGDIPSADANADALLDRADAIETGWTLRKAIRVMAAVLAGKVSGGATATNTFRDLTDAKDRVTSTVDSDGNRTAVTLDGS